MFGEKKLTANEIRENMHRTLNSCQPDLISYWQFNENSGSVLDVARHYNGTVTGAISVASTCPVGSGTANSQLENFGVVNFSEADFIADYEVQENANITASKLNLAPHGSTGIPVDDILLGNQYWIVNRFEEDGDLNATFTFGLNDDISSADEATPFGFKIYNRPFNSDADWTFLTNATEANDENNTVTFPDISTYGQYLLSRSTESVMAISVNELKFCLSDNNQNEDPLSYLAGGTYLTDPLTISVVGDYEISLDLQNNYSNQISLNPINGTIGQTTIFVRPGPGSINPDDGQIIHTTSNLNSDTLTVSAGFFGKIASNALSGNSISDYLTLPQNEELLFGPTQDFTVEFWIYTDATNSDPSIISNKNWNSGHNVGWGLFYRGNDWKVNINGAGGSRVDLNSNAPPINDGNWHHLVAVFDRDDQLSIYQDGFLTNQVSIAGLYDKNINSGFPINILQDGTGTYSIPMAAKIDELRLWNTVRSTQQIRENMHLSIKCTESDLVAYYQFNENSGECLDVAGEHHGTLMNNATRIPSDVPVAGGVSVTKDIQLAQNYSFEDNGIDTGLDINFSGTLPSGEVVVSKLTAEIPHGIPPNENTLTDSYWIINNFGANTSGLDAEMIFQTPEGWVNLQDANAYQLHQRNSNATDVETWTDLTNATAVDVGTDQVNFSGINSFSQFVLSKNISASCSDGVQNGDETGIDCGGSSCPPCTCNLLPDISSFCVKRSACDNGMTIIDWADVAGAAMYEFHGEALSGTPQLNRTVSNSGFSIPPGVPNNFQVLVQLRAQCLPVGEADGTWGEWTPLTPYTISNADCDCGAELNKSEIDKLKVLDLSTLFSIKDQFHIYPNPTIDILNISAVNLEEFQLEIVDMYGNVSYTGKPITGSAQLNVSHLAPGIYFLRLKNKEFQTVRKFTKH